MITQALNLEKTPSKTQPSSEAQDQYPKTPKPNIKRKMQLCRNYLQSGYCRYNTKCQFAHGTEELQRNQTTNHKYKTKKCLSFFDKRWCLYGQRCNFLHITDEQKKSGRQIYNIALKQYREIIIKRKRESTLFPTQA